MAWLMLGDHLSELGNREKATLCWRLAIDRDGRRGAATLAAEHELACAEQDETFYDQAVSRPAS